MTLKIFLLDIILSYLYLFPADFFVCLPVFLFWEVILHALIIYI